MMMNKAFLAMAALAGLSFSVDAQVDNRVCANMQPICTSETYTFEATGDGEILPEETGNYYGCLFSTPGPAWYFLEIDNPGQIVMNLVAGNDVDFSVWGPYDSVAEAISLCDGGLTESAQIDCSFDPTNDETIEIPDGISGKFYVLLITNFARIPQAITFRKTGGPGTTNCEIVEDPPVIAPTASPHCDPDVSADFECTSNTFVNGVETCPDNNRFGYYPDLTNKNGYCYCTGTAAPSRYELCPNGLHWDSVTWAYLDGSDVDGTSLGSGGYWGTIGGVCNWPNAVSAQTQERPPWTRRRRLDDDCEETPTPSPVSSPDEASFCTASTFVNGVGTCPSGIPDGYYPDLTDKGSYCKCTGTKAPSRRETCPNGLHWDSVNWSYIPGNDPTGVALGSGGYWGTIGGICNWPAAVSSQTRDRPPWSRRRNLLRSQK